MIKLSEKVDVINKRVKTLIGKDSDGFCVSGMWVDRRYPWILIGDFNSYSKFSINTEIERGDRELLKERILETLEIMKKQIDERIEKIKND